MAVQLMSRIGVVIRVKKTVANVSQDVAMGDGGEATSRTSGQDGMPRKEGV